MLCTTLMSDMTDPTETNSVIVFANPGSKFLSVNMVTAQMLLRVLFVSGELFVICYLETLATCIIYSLNLILPQSRKTSADRVTVSS